MYSTIKSVSKPSPTFNRYNPINKTAAKKTPTAGAKSNDASSQSTWIYPIAHGFDKKLNNLGVTMDDLAEMSQRLGIEFATIEFIFRNIVLDRGAVDFKEIRICFHY